LLLQATTIILFEAWGYEELDIHTEHVLGVLITMDGIFWRQPMNHYVTGLAERSWYVFLANVLVFKSGVPGLTLTLFAPFFSVGRVLALPGTVFLPT
jgi:hypothetical protein